MQYRSAKNKFKLLYDDLEDLLASSPDFLLGKWLESAKKSAPTPNERENFEFNARNQITLWGPNGEIVDYANKQWSGVVKDYFALRWSIFLQELLKSIRNNEEIDNDRVKRIIFDVVELPFSYSKKSYPVLPKGEHR